MLLRLKGLLPGAWMVGPGMKLRHCVWFSGLAVLLGMVESTGVWPQGLLDACVAMIPKAGGDSTPLGQRLLCVLPINYRLWASLRLSHLKDWVRSWVPESVFSVGNGVSSVKAWFSATLDVEEVLFGARDDQLHVPVADVIKSFDTVDRSMLDCALGRFGVLRCWHGGPWCRDRGVPQGCPLSMMFILALFVP